MSFEQNWEIDFFIYAHEIVKSDYCALAPKNKSENCQTKLAISRKNTKCPAMVECLLSTGLRYLNISQPTRVRFACLTPNPQKV